MRDIRSILVQIIIVSLIFCGIAIGYSTPTQDESDETTAAPDNSELQRLIETTVSQKIRPLQREIAELKDELRFHDILGGIGYIVGIAGIVFYFLGVRRRENEQKANKAE